MSWTYGNDPSNSDLDAVRLLLGDTDSSKPQMSDEELNYFISEYTTVQMAASMAARSLASKYARLVTKEVGDLRIEYSDLYRHYLDLAGSLLEQAALEGASPFLGGYSTSDKDTLYDDTTKVQPYFIRDQFDDQ